MKNSRRFELRCGDKTWGVLLVLNQGKTLKHDPLNRTEVMMCPSLVPYDERGRALSVTKGGGQVSLFSDNSEAVQLKCDDRDIITDVVDPAGDVSLIIKLDDDQSVGPSVGTDRIGQSRFALGLRWLRG